MRTAERIARLREGARRIAEEPLTEVPGGLMREVEPMMEWDELFGPKVGFASRTHAILCLLLAAERLARPVKGHDR